MAKKCIKGEADIVAQSNCANGAPKKSMAEQMCRRRADGDLGIDTGANHGMAATAAA